MCTRFKVEQLSWGVKSCSKKQQQINSGSCRERGEGWESACEWGRHWGGRIHSPQRLSVSQDFPSRTLLLLLLWVCSLRGHTLPYLDLDLAKQWRVDCDAKFKLNCGRSIYAWMVDVGITSYCKSTRAEKSDCLNDFKHQVSPISFGVDCCFIQIFLFWAKFSFFRLDWTVRLKWIPLRLESQIVLSLQIKQEVFFVSRAEVLEIAHAVSKL